MGTVRRAAVFLSLPLALCGVVGGVGLTTACSFQHCFTGISVFNGQSAIGLDTVIRLDGPWMQPSSPWLGGTVTLEDITTGQPVPFRQRVDLDRGLWVVTPKGGLKPDHDYQLTGVNLSTVDSRHYASSTSRWMGRSVQFTTRSAPAVVGAVFNGDDEVVLVLSEAIVREDLERITVSFQDVSLPSRWVGFVRSDLHLVRYEVPDLLAAQDVTGSDTGGAGGKLDSITVTYEQLRSVEGAGIAPAESVEVPFDSELSFRDRFVKFRDDAWCE